MKRFARPALRVFLSLISAVLAFNAAQAQTKDKDPDNVGSSNTVVSNPKTDSQTYLIVFPEPGAMHYTGDIPEFKATIPDGSRKYDVSAPSILAYRQYLHKLQATHVGAIEKLLGHPLSIRHNYDLIKSGIAADKLSAQEAKAISEFLGYPTFANYDEQPSTFRGPIYIGADSVWSGMSTPDHRAHTGVATTIGILDSGYSAWHPSFAPMPAVCNGERYGPFLKVDSAVDCSSGAPCLDAASGGDPADHSGHGSHVGSIAAGNTLSTSTALSPIPRLPMGFSQMSGVAPCAALRFYKICNLRSCPSVDVLAGQEAAIADAVDVVNYSITGGRDPWSQMTPSVHAPNSNLGFLDVVAANIVVVAAAGNTTMDDLHIESNPVGAVMHRGPWMLTVAASSHDLNSLVLTTPPRMQGDVLASFSLRGPNESGISLDEYTYAGFDVTKPDIAAPGIHIYAATNVTYQYNDGTSMASPHVAGAAALVREAHPDWSALEVMSALRLTAATRGTKENGSTPWDADDVGNGRVDLTQATRAALVMDESIIHFVQADPAIGGDPKTLNLPAVRNTHCTPRCSWTRQLRNGVSTPVTWTVTSFDTPNAAISVSQMTFTLLPRGTRRDSFPHEVIDAQSITITAIPHSTIPGAVEFGSIVLHATSRDGSIPDEHITVAVQVR